MPEQVGRHAACVQHVLELGRAYPGVLARVMLVTQGSTGISAESDAVQAAVASLAESMGWAYHEVCV